MAEWIISSSALILAVVLLRRVLRGRLSPRLQYALWALVLVRLLVPVSFGAAGLSVQNLVRGADERAAERVVTYVSNAAPDLSIPEPVTDLSEPEQQLQYDQELPAPVHEPDAAEPEARAETGTPVTVSDILRYAWYAGMAVLALWFLAANIAFRARLTRSARSMEHPDCKLPLYVSGAVETPCLFGVVRPAVYLTPGAAADPVTLTHSVEHELTHFRHGDHVWALLRCLCLVLHWYNPLVWLAAALSRRDAELACDEATIKRLGEAERAAYGRTLIGITCGSRPSLLRTATTMNCGKSGLRERISLIVKRPKTAAWALVIFLLAAVFVTGCTFTGAQAAEPELDGFIAENTGLTAGEGQYLAASYELLLEEDDTYYVNCCVTVFELAEDRTLTMAENVLTPMSLTLRRSGGGWTQEAFWMPEDGDYNDPELEERFPQAALERLNELSSRGSLPLAMRCFEKAVPALDADVAAAIEPYLSGLVESGTTVEDASSTRNMAYAMIAFYGSCAVEYMQEQLSQPDLSEERRLILTEAIAYVEEMRELERTNEPDPDTLAGLMAAVTAEDIKYIACDSGKVTAEQLAPALNAAAANQTALDTDGLDTWYSLTAYLTDEYSSEVERIELRAGLEENAVYVRYKSNTGTREGKFTDSVLYRLILDSYSTLTNIEAEHYEKYRGMIEARAASDVQRAEKYDGSPAFTGYEITSFEQTDVFEGDGVQYEVYAWNVAFTTGGSTESIPFAGGMTLDAEGRVIGYETDTYFAVKVLDDGSYDYRFLTGELYQGTNEAAGRENAKAQVLAAFAEPQTFTPVVAQPIDGVICVGTEISSGELVYYVPGSQEEWRRLLNEAVPKAQGGTYYIDGTAMLGQLIIDGERELFFISDGSLSSMGEAFVINAQDAAPLRELMDDALEVLGVYGHVAPSDIRDLSSATLEIFGGTATVTDEASLAEIERLLSASSGISPSKCGCGLMMKLEREDGTILNIGMAGDGCATWQSNGWYYDYGDGNKYLYSFFVPHIIHGMDAATLFETYDGRPLNYMNWARYCNEFDYDDCFELMDEMFERAKTDNSVRAGCMYNTQGLDGALAEAYGNYLAQLYEYDPAAFAAAFYNVPDEQQTMLIGMITVTLDITPDEFRTQIEALW